MLIRNNKQANKPKKIPTIRHPNILDPTIQKIDLHTTYENRRIKNQIKKSNDR
jgi:hypothetical protein